MKILVKEGEKIVSFLLDKILNSFELIMISNLINIEKAFLIIIILFFIKQILKKLNTKLK